MITHRRWRGVLLAASVTAAAPSIAPLYAQQANDVAYTAKIRELTPTDPKWKFTTELVDHLPASNAVPTPLKVLGYVPGTIGRLSRTEDLNKYFRAVEAASPRVKVFSLGKSEEGREMIVAAVADENTIKRLDDYRAMAARLADPRGVSDAERTRLIHEAKPIYWLTGSIHSPETGSPEMLMELLYRLAVEETPFVQKIRNNVITLITPATEVDGRDRIVDIIEEEKHLKLGRGGIPTVYWGKYIAHDNNRDGLMMSIKLTQNMNTGFLHWRPTIMHDLHESVPFLYTSTGTGPYNDEFDPITVSEWHTLAYQEINELTKRGLPGVWTHGFYDGWAPNYMMGIVQFRNAMGKFYETYTSGGADCQIVNLPASATSKEWYRPNPPVNGIKWCIRSNINYQQSGVLIALKYVADNRDTFMDNYAAKAVRMVERGRTSAPYAFVIPHDQRHAAEAADLVNYFRKVGTEVHVATGSFTIRAMPPVVERGIIASGQGGGAAAPGGRGGRGGRGEGDSTAARDTSHVSRSVTVNAGDWIVRMDQPYTALIRTVLALQRFRPDDPSPYDDTGWSLDQLRHLTVHTIADSSVLTRPMALLKDDVHVNGSVAGNGGALIVSHSGDWRSAVLPWKVGSSTKLTVADSAFTINGTTYQPGTYIVDNSTSIRDAVTQLGMNAVAVNAAPSVRSHVVQLPRIAFIHTWIETQNEGWVRHALEEMGVPFTYMSTQRLKEPGLLDRFDVVLFPHVSGPTTSMVNGKPRVGPAVPWKTTALTPNIGRIDSTDDIRPELALEGLAALRRFVERGGLLLVEGNTSRLPIDFGLTPSVSVVATPRLQARGAIFRAEAVTRSSPILYGYERGAIPVYFNTAPLFSIASGRGGGEGPGGAGSTDEERSLSVAQNRPDPSIARQTAAMRPRVILRFETNVDSLLVSGLLDNGTEMMGRAAIVDAPLGQGHVILFGIRPMWRYETQGSYAMVLNALANWNALDVNERPQRVAADGAQYHH